MQKDNRMSKRPTNIVLTAVIGTLLPLTAGADSLVSSMGIYTYPAAGQTAQQQSEDDYACFDWAKQQTGYDPMNPPEVVAQASDQGRSGSRLRGAARGAAAGAVVSEITDNDTSDAMAAGAALGVMRGGRQERMSRQEQAAQAEVAAGQQEDANANQFKGAYAACIEGRGYSVKY
jgi:hypothetical protein